MTLTAPGSDLLQIESREKLVSLCHQMLEGELSFFEGAMQVCALRFALGLDDNDPDLLAFVGIASETDHLPPKHIQHRWSAAALRRLQPEFDRTEIWARAVGEKFCRNIIARLTHL